MAATTDRGPVLIVAVFLAAAAVAAAKEVSPDSLADWETYVAATEARRASEVARADGFLALDFTTGRRTARTRINAGDAVIERLERPGAAGTDVDVRDADVHHWRGAILVPGVTVDEVLRALREGPPPQEDVLDSRVLGRAGDTMDVFLRLRRTQIITVVYDTEHRVTFDRFDAGRAASTTVATRIVEISDAGEPGERTLSPEEDHGFLWRLHAYWRYEAVPGGVIAECESLALSREAPWGLGLIAGPIVRRASEGSMEAALRAVAALGTDRTPPALSPVR